MRDTQREPCLPDDEWKLRFIARLVTAGSKRAAPDFNVAEYAPEAADAYLPDRHLYTDPEEAADTDISYWEDG